MRALWIRRWCAAIAATGLLALGTVGLAASPASADTRTDFWVFCNFNGVSATIDPIKDPGSTTAGHFHDFFGNTTINQNSTPSTLQSVGVSGDSNPYTSCTTATDTAAYWFPRLLLGPGESQTYGPSGYPCFADPNSAYSHYTVCHGASIRAYYGGDQSNPSLIYSATPFGSEEIGGTPDATGPPANLQGISFACGGSTPDEPYPYDCSPYINLSGDQNGVVIRVDMPRCWNGQDPNVYTNFQYPTGTGQYDTNCPSLYPHLLPMVNPRLHTGIVDPCAGLSYDGKCTLTDEQNCLNTPGCTPYAPNFNFEQSDGSILPWYDAHADFMNGWQYGNHNAADGGTDTLGGLDDLENDCLLGASSVTCPANPHTGPNSDNMPT